MPKNAQKFYPNGWRNCNKMIIFAKINVKNTKIVKSLRFLIFFICFIMYSTTAYCYTDHRNRKADSLENIIATQKPTDKIELIKIYSDLSWAYLETDGEKSTSYCDLGIPLCEEVGGWLKLCDFHRIKAMIHWGGARYNEAAQELDLSQQAVEKMRESGRYSETDIDDQASALYGTLGNLYNTIGDGAKALNYYHKALTLFTKYGWRESQVVCYSNMSELYYCMGNLSHAYEYDCKVDSLARICNDSLMLCLAREGFAKLALQAGDYEKAKDYIGQNYEYLFAHPEENGTSRSECLLLLTDIAMAEGDWTKAAEYIAENEALGVEILDNDATFYSQKAELSAHNKKWKEAEGYALKAMEYDIDAPDVAKETYKLLSDIYAHLNRPELTKLYANKADSIQTAWSNYAYQTSLAEQETMFESEKKDLQIAALAKEKSYMTAVIIIVIVLLILLVLALFLIRQNHKRQKSILATEVALETEKRERQILAKDLHDSLGGMLSLLKIKIGENNQEEAMQLVDESSKEMRRIAHHIMPTELQEKGLVTSLSNFAIAVPGAHFHYYSSIDDENNPQRLPNDIELVLYRSAYELVNNAIKHASANRIDIQLMREEKQIALTISDNGKGFDQTQNSGMGLQNIKNRISQFDGQLEIISNSELGTEINITLPL